VTSDDVDISSLGAVSVSAKSALVSFEPDPNVSGGDTITIRLHLVAGDDDGEIKVQLDGRDSDISSGTYTVATIGEGRTTARVIDDPVKAWRGEFTGTAIEIRENTISSIGDEDQKIKLSLPTGVEWIGANFKGNLSDSSGVRISSGVGTRDIIVEFTSESNPLVRQTLNIEPIIRITRDAKKGDIAVSIRRQDQVGHISNASGLVVGEYVDESVSVTTVKEKDLPDIIAGRETDEAGEPYMVEEDIISALNGNRFVEFEFPDYVQIVSGEAVTVQYKGTYSIEREVVITGNSDEDNSVIEYTIRDALDRAKKDKLRFNFPVTVAADTPDCDLVVKVSGAKAGIPDTDVTVAKILAPVDVKVELSDLRTGVQKQALGSITITERFPGALRDGTDDNKLEVSLSDKIVKEINDFDKDSVKIVKGDIVLDLDKNKKLTTPGIQIHVDSVSIKDPAEIKISGPTVTLDRTPAEGKYSASVGGTALVDNAQYNGWNFSGSVWEGDYLNVVTPADSDVYSQASFTIDERSYKALVNGDWKTIAMDAAPFIDGNNRTMVPVRYAAEALGVPDSLVTYDSLSKTVTIIKGSKVISVPVGKNYLVANGSQINTDTAAVNKDGRVYLPVAPITLALGSTYTWDGATKTVTITNLDLK